MAKELSSGIGRHTWITRVERGESYKVCPNCGKTLRGGKKETRSPNGSIGDTTSALATADEARRDHRAAAG